MKIYFFQIIISICIICFLLTGCLGEDSSNDTKNGTVACRLDDFNQCVEWINLSDAMVKSLESTCVNDDNGIVVDSCSTENLVGVCEELNDPTTPDLLNYFYLRPGSDPTTIEGYKEEACIDAGGVWKSAN